MSSLCPIHQLVSFPVQFHSLPRLLPLDSCLLILAPAAVDHVPLVKAGTQFFFMLFCYLLFWVRVYDVLMWCFIWVKAVAPLDCCFARIYMKISH